MIPFDKTNKEHRLICLAAMATAEQLGAGLITACKEQLELADIRPYSTRTEQDTFQKAVFDWSENDLRRIAEAK